MRQRDRIWAPCLVLLFYARLAAGSEGYFVDRSAEVGLDFEHDNGMSGEFYFPEMTGQGGALLDYDDDGDLDLYLVQGGALGPASAAAGSGPTDRLFRNDGLRFVDVTSASGLSAAGYGMGAATGDVDNDGDVDLYLTNFGANQLWLNEGDGTFRESTAAAGAEDSRWSTSASFVDYDRDGWLDLYVVNYVEFDLAANPTCYAPSSRRDYCGPGAFVPQSDRLLRNLGDGRFEDVTLRALPAYTAGPGLGVTTADFDGNGWLDLYVANDGEMNQLWLNRGDGTFSETALLSGSAVNRAGQAEASMGVDAGDFDGDGDEDLFLAHLTGETNTLFVNDGGGLFEDRSTEAGLGVPSLGLTAFGTGWLDVDNDGWLDLLVANGAVRILEEQAAAGDAFPLRQPNQFFRNRGDGSFEDRSSEAGPAFASEEVSRGLSLGDVDNDGDVDAVLFNNAGPARLLVNEVGDRAGWLGARPLADASGGTALGVVVEVHTEGGVARLRRTRTDGSYCSARDPRISAGLGEGVAARLRALWPDGSQSEWLDPPPARYLTLVRAGRNRIAGGR